MGWFTESQRGKMGENRGKWPKFRSSKEKKVCVSCGEMLRGEEELGGDSAGWWGWEEGSCPLLLGITTTPSLPALLERPRHLAREGSWDQRLGQSWCKCRETTETNSKQQRNGRRVNFDWVSM